MVKESIFTAFCQNLSFSQLEDGRAVKVDEGGWTISYVIFWEYPNKRRVSKSLLIWESFNTVCRVSPWSPQLSLWNSLRALGWLSSTWRNLTTCSRVAFSIYTILWHYSIAPFLLFNLHSTCFLSACFCLSVQLWGKHQERRYLATFCISISSMFK